MAVFLIDYENVNSSDGLRGLKFLSQDDKLIIFYSNACARISAEYIRYIEKNGCEFQVHKLVNTGKNALDFYIAVECGILYEQGFRQIAIVTKDKGFQAIIDYFKKKKDSDLCIKKANNVENAILALNDPMDHKRRREIQEKTEMLEIEVEQMRIEMLMSFRKKIKELFQGSPYEELTDQILDYIDNKRDCTPKQLYTGALHEFGRHNGTEIYRIIKRVV